MWVYNYPDELYHYGRQGMKWGQHIFGGIKARRAAKRRAANLKKAREVRAANKKAAAERAEKVAAGKISAKNMTEAELKKRIERLELEKRYNDLRKDSNSNTKAKRFLDKFVDTTIDKVAENAAADVIAQSLKVLTTKGANKVFGEEVVFTNNKKK